MKPHRKTQFFESITKGQNIKKIQFHFRFEGHRAEQKWEWSQTLPVQLIYLWEVVIYDYDLQVIRSTHTVYEKTCFFYRVIILWIRVNQISLFKGSVAHSYEYQGCFFVSPAWTMLIFRGRWPPNFCMPFW